METYYVSVFDLNVLLFGLHLQDKTIRLWNIAGSQSADVPLMEKKRAFGMNMYKVQTFSKYNLGIMKYSIELDCDDRTSDEIQRIFLNNLNGHSSNEVMHYDYR